MAVTVRVPTILRSLTGGASEVGVEGAATLAELLGKHDPLKVELFDGRGKRIGDAAS